jgi:cytochrome c biogenesis protein CcmG/thiol:disulfide interchange protein DsbE
MVRKIRDWAAVGIAALVLVLFAMPSYRQGEASIAGKTAQDFPLEIWGKPGHLTDLKGKVVILNFWASWCAACIEETPSLNRLQKYVESRNALILGVSIDEDPAAYEQSLKEQGIVFPTFREREQKLALDYGSPNIPDTYVIDRRGKILRKFIGPQQWDSADMLAYFDSILGNS